jgi:hypothetical protein
MAAALFRASPRTVPSSRACRTKGRGHLLYRVRSDTEQYERVVAEMDLSRAENDEA